MKTHDYVMISLHMSILEYLSAEYEKTICNINSNYLLEMTNEHAIKMMVSLVYIQIIM